MASMIARRSRLAFTCVRTCELCCTSVRWKFTRWQDDVREAKEEALEKEMKRRIVDHKQGIYVTAEDHMQVMPKKDYEDMTHQDVGGAPFDYKVKFVASKFIDMSLQHRLRHARYKMLLMLQYDQRFLPERHLILGSDLAAAHFIVHRGGSVKFFDNENWVTHDKSTGEYDLPRRMVEGLYLEAIDASDTSIVWEGFDNLIRLKKLRYLSLAQCPYIDDWCMNRLHQFARSLEYLDLSGCTRLSAQGLSAIATCQKLKFLRIEGLDHVKDIAKVAMMLEDAIPGLQVVGIDYDRAMKSLEQEQRLLHHPSIVEDAKGNLFLKDNSDELYYVKGSIPEPAIVDEHGLPLYVSKIRLDPPDLPPEVVEKVNRLSEGKLKHLLVGSPSGEWTLETERILTYEAYLKHSRGEEIDPVLLPECMKKPPVKEGLWSQVKKYLPFGYENEANLPPAVRLALDTAQKDAAIMLAEPLKNTETVPVEYAAAKQLLLPSADEPISLDVLSPPPKPRPARIFGKFTRHVADQTTK